MLDQLRGRRPEQRFSFARWLKFNAVGLIGTGVQFLVLALLVRVAHTGYLLATAVAVETAVLHNFAWHRNFTWADRAAGGRRPGFDALLRFNLTTGLFSIGGNLLLMQALCGPLKLDPLPANAIAIAVCSLVNFLVSDRFVFVMNSAEPRRSQRV